MPLIAVSMTGFCFPGIAADKTETNMKAAQISDIIEAVECFKKANSFLTDEKYPEALKWYRKAAEKGHIEAQYLLGRCYSEGISVKIDMAEAVKWFRKSAERGYAPAEYSLGFCYTNGNGVQKDMTEAVKWFRKAAEQGVTGAQYYLGIQYAKGEGVQKDMAEAVKWLRKVAESYESELKTAYSSRTSLNLAELYMILDEYDKTLSCLNRIQEDKSPRNQALRSYLKACALLAKGENAEAEIQQFTAVLPSVSDFNWNTDEFRFWAGQAKISGSALKKMIELTDQIDRKKHK